MELVRIKYEMDKEYRVKPLNEAFLEALYMSEGLSCEEEEFENNLLDIINTLPNSEDKDKFLSIIKDEYKVSVVKSCGYKIDKHIWVNKLAPVGSSIEAYPLRVQSQFLVKMLKEIHRDEEDLYEGDLLDRVWEYSEYSYVLSEVNIEDIDCDGFHIDESIVDDYIKESVDEMPPIVLEMPISYKGEILEKFPLIDGAHRCTVLKKLGLSKIQAYVPMPIGG